MARFELASPDMALLAGAVFTADMFYELGIQYSAGRNGTVDLVEAHKWFNVAAAKGCRDAVLRRGELAAEMSREAVAEAQRAARTFLALH